MVMAELLARGFDAYWADRGNPAYDIACFSPNRKASRLRVKTTSDGAAVWREKKTGIFLDVGEHDDFVVICDIRNGVRGANLYIVPTQVVEKELVDVHKHYCSHVGRHGKPRDGGTSIRILHFFGEDKEDDRSYGYHKKFATYREAWDALSALSSDSAVRNLELRLPEPPDHQGLELDGGGPSPRLASAAR